MMQKKDAQGKGIVECGISIEDSEVSGVQGLDPKENFQPFI